MLSLKKPNNVFELQIALKYLVPRKKSLSTALISFLSVFVISLVIWLVLVFLSVTSGMEKNWLKKLTALHAPIRIAPTETYYSSYYYQVDSLSAASGYSCKTIGEKWEASLSDPHSPDSDVEIPIYWPSADRLSNGSLRDPVKIAFQELQALKEELPHIAFQDYEISGALLRLVLKNGTSLSQMTYLLSFSEDNPHLSSLLLEPKDQSEMTADAEALFPVFLPKSYQAQGVTLHDRGVLNFSAASTSSFQEQRMHVRIAGFYDPGMLAIGNKCALVPHEVTRMISATTQTMSPDGTPTNGIFVWVDDLSNTSAIASRIEERLREAGIGAYWTVSTYKDFEFSKDLLTQFQSDKTLLLLIASIILIVACSNIISLLVLLVHDKKKEIAILQSMGASFKSIATIFAACGVSMGMLGCLFGSLAAVFTLHNLDHLVAFLSFVQGRTAFNPNFFGQSLPNQLSWEALLFVLIATPLLSLAAGIIPALKASRIHPSSTLRSE